MQIADFQIVMMLYAFKESIELFTVDERVCT